MGLVYSAFIFVYTIFMTPGGWFIDRFGAWRALVIMGFGSALFGMLTGMIGWFLFSGVALWLGLMIIRSLMGLFTAPIYPASGKIIARWFPLPQRALANGLVIGAALAGNASTFFGFGLLIDGCGWQTAFLITGGVTAFFALLWMMYAREDPSQHPSVNLAEIQIIHPTPQAQFAPARVQAGATEQLSDPSIELPDLTKNYIPPSANVLSLLRNRSLVLLTVSYAAVGYFEYLFYFWIEYYFLTELELSQKQSRIAATIATSAMAVGMFLGGWLADLATRRFGHRLGRAIVPVTGMTTSAFLLYLGFTATEAEWVVVWFSLAMAAVGASEGPFWATAIELGGKRGGTSAGIFNTGGNVGGFLSPAITPVIGETFGWDYGIGLASIVCLAGVILWFWIDPSERRPEDSEAPVSKGTKA